MAVRWGLEERGRDSKRDPAVCRQALHKVLPALRVFPGQRTLQANGAGGDLVRSPCLKDLPAVSREKSWALRANLYARQA